MVLRCCLFLTCVLFSLERTAWAQTDEGVEKDSLMSYDLAEIVIEGSERQAASAATMQAGAASIDRVMRLIPAAHVQTNSRGETLVYLRNAGERQVALFFDGALLNVPWDNRFDLGLVPANVIGGITVAKGVPSVLYGANVLGGAINLTSRVLENPGTFTQAMSVLGSPGAAEARLTHLGRSERVAYTFSMGYTERDGIALADEFTGGAQLGLSLLHLDADKGIAPEGHLDPEQSRVRFWRYPTWRTSMVILNGQVPLGRQGARLRGAAWGSRFAQTISQFGSEAYDVLLEEQDDDDYTFGTRLTLLQPAGSGELRLALNALTSRHEQQNLEYEDGAPSLPPDPALTFRQHIWSVGGEYLWRPKDRLELLLGASLDGIATPATGDKPDRGPQVDFGVTSGVLYSLDEAWTLRASAGRKVRFPTMRELFGEALPMAKFPGSAGADRSHRFKLAEVRQPGNRNSASRTARVRGSDPGCLLQLETSMPDVV